MKRFTTGCGVVSPGVAAPTPSLFSAAIRASRRPSPRSRFSRYSAATAAIVSSSAPRARSRCTAAWPTVISYPRTCSAVLSACRCSSSRRLNRSICSYSTEAVCFAYRRFLTMVLSFLIRFSGTRLASRCIVVGHAAVYADVVEGDAFAFQCLHHQVVCRPKGLFRKGSCAEPILIGHHYKIKIQLAADEAKIAHHFRIELQLLQGVQLIINGRLND